MIATADHAMTVLGGPASAALGGAVVGLAAIIVGVAFGWSALTDPARRRGDDGQVD